MAKVLLRDMVNAIVDAAIEQGYVVIVGEGDAQRVTLEIVDADIWQPDPPPLGVSVSEQIDTSDKVGS